VVHYFFTTTENTPECLRALEGLRGRLIGFEALMELDTVTAPPHLGLGRPWRLGGHCTDGMRAAIVACASFAGEGQDVG
jgi:hypothetical protein